DYLLFGDEAETLANSAGDFRCRFGLAIARNLEMVSRELATGWYRPNGVAAHLLSPNAENVDYRSRTEATEALLGVLSHGLEALRDTRINPFIARGGAAAKPKQA